LRRSPPVVESRVARSLHLQGWYSCRCLVGALGSGLERTMNAGGKTRHEERGREPDRKPDRDDIREDLERVGRHRPHVLVQGVDGEADSAEGEHALPEANAPLLAEEELP